MNNKKKSHKKWFMFSFTCSFVNENIFELNKKFNSRTLVQVPEHAGFALLRCQPRGSCGAAARSRPPGEGESFCEHLEYIYGICGITKHRVREQVMVFPSPLLWRNSTISYCNSISLQWPRPCPPQTGKVQPAVSLG